MQRQQLVLCMIMPLEVTTQTLNVHSMVVSTICFLKRERKTLYILILELGVRRRRAGRCEQMVVLPTTINGALEVPVRAPAPERGFLWPLFFAFFLDPSFWCAWCWKRRSNGVPVRSIMSSTCSLKNIGPLNSLLLWGAFYWT